MHKKGKIFVLSLLLALTITAVQAQKSTFHTNATLGIGTPILDNGTSYHIGVNPFYELSNHFAVEGQVSFAYSNITGSFLSGDKKKEYSFNALAGPRLFFTKPDKKIRPYINFLLGLNYLDEREGSEAKRTGSNVGFSTGVYVNINQVLVGLSVEAPNLFLLKLGYTF